jgi:hypothetical protein
MLHQILRYFNTPIFYFDITKNKLNQQRLSQALPSQSIAITLDFEQVSAYFFKLGAFNFICQEEIKKETEAKHKCNTTRTHA